MNREDLRKVEFTVREKVKSKKGKKSQKKQVKKNGLFHIWNPDGKNKKRFYGLVEDMETGLLREVSYKDIRFVSESETPVQAEEVQDAQPAQTENETASEPAQAEAPAPAQAEAEEPKKETPAPTSRRKAGSE